MRSNCTSSSSYFALTTTELQFPQNNEYLQIQHLSRGNPVRDEDALKHRSERVALITGITGQDGLYMTAHLLFHQQEFRYKVHGIVRKNSINLPVLMEMSRLYPGDLFLHFGDVTDSTFMLNTIKNTKPDELYNFAAQSQVGDSFANPTSTFDLNTKSLWYIFQSIIALDL